MVMKARLKRPKSSEARSLKSDTPRIESAIYIYIYKSSREGCIIPSQTVAFRLVRKYTRRVGRKWHLHVLYRRGEQGVRRRTRSGRFSGERLRIETKRTLKPNQTNLEEEQIVKHYFAGISNLGDSSKMKRSKNFEERQAFLYIIYIFFISNNKN